MNGRKQLFVEASVTLTAFKGPLCYGWATACSSKGASGVLRWVAQSALFALG